MGFVCLFVLEVLTLLSKIQHFLPQFFCLIVLFNVKKASFVAGITGAYIVVSADTPIQIQHFYKCH